MVLSAARLALLLSLARLSFAADSCAGVRKETEVENCGDLCDTITDPKRCALKAVPTLRQFDINQASWTLKDYCADVCADCVSDEEKGTCVEYCKGCPGQIHVSNYTRIRYHLTLKFASKQADLCHRSVAMIAVLKEIIRGPGGRVQIKGKFDSLAKEFAGTPGLQLTYDSMIDMEKKCPTEVMTDMYEWAAFDDGADYPYNPFTKEPSNCMLWVRSLIRMECNPQYYDKIKKITTRPSAKKWAIGKGKSVEEMWPNRGSEWRYQKAGGYFSNTRRPTGFCPSAVTTAAGFGSGDYTCTKYCEYCYAIMDKPTRISSGYTIEAPINLGAALPGQIGTYLKNGNQVYSQSSILKMITYKLSYYINAQYCSSPFEDCYHTEKTKPSCEKVYVRHKIVSYSGEKCFGNALCKAGHEAPPGFYQPNPLEISNNEYWYPPWCMVESQKVDWCYKNCKVDLETMLKPGWWKKLPAYQKVFFVICSVIAGYCCCCCCMVCALEITCIYMCCTCCTSCCGALKAKATAEKKEEKKAAEEEPAVEMGEGENEKEPFWKKERGLDAPQQMQIENVEEGGSDEEGPNSKTGRSGGEGDDEDE